MYKIVSFREEHIDIFFHFKMLSYSECYLGFWIGFINMNLDHLHKIAIP